MPSPRYTKADL